MKLCALRAAAVAAVLLLTASQARAQYQYGGTGSGGYDEAALVLFFEAGVYNPRNTDNVVAVRNDAVRTEIIPAWDGDFAGRAGLAWQWSGGRVGLTTWGYYTEADFAGTGNLSYPIGPAVWTGSDFIGDTGGAIDVSTHIEADTADLYWSRPHSPTDKLTLEWSAGLRYARYEETAAARYDDGVFRYAAQKSNEGDMIGVRLGLRGTYRFFSKVDLGWGLAFSQLDGELSASSTLSPNPSSFPAGAAAVTDDGRSGAMRELELVAGWRVVEDMVRVWAGWEQAIWEDIASDLMRNQPGAGVTLDARDSVTFSGYKIGVEVRF